MSSGFTGGCLCGAVRYESASEPRITVHCHCEDCRRSSGTGHCTHLAIPEEAFSISGAVTFFERAADSGNMVRRGFCPSCGSPLYSTNSGMPGMIAIRASSLDDLETVKPQMVVYASRAASWEHIDKDLTAFPEMPPNAARPAIART
ncbi:GFA family protein [Pelagibius sp.]|uniref:GFA family protein n=1 Tax=Pelagibius sp. TaxID=1931238 RepID=UPI002613187B|nr:GFA family protein [Pelagibius sp.]